MKFLSTEFNQLSVFRNYTDVQRGFERVVEVNGGSIPVYVLARTDGDPLAPERGQRMLKLEEQLSASPAVAKVVSAYDAYALVNAGLRGTEEAVYPQTLEEVSYIEALISGESDPTAHLLNRREQAARLIVFPADLQDGTLDAIATAVSEADRRLPGVQLKLTGGQFLMRELNASMIGNQARSILLAFAIILALLVLSLRKLLPAVASLLPIACTTLTIFGFMGAAGISLNLFTATIFSIAIGVGIDYAVHFTSVWMSFRDAGYNTRHAAELALAYTGRPIIANAFGLAIGLSALLLSPLRIHVYMSLLMWVAMVSGVFLSLSFLPTVLRSIPDRRFYALPTEWKPSRSFRRSSHRPKADSARSRQSSRARLRTNHSQRSVPRLSRRQLRR
jgi:hypothetical protein